MKKQALLFAVLTSLLATSLAFGGSYWGRGGGGGGGGGGSGTVSAGTTHMVPAYTNGALAIIGNSLSFYDAGSSGIGTQAGSAFIGDPIGLVGLQTSIVGSGASARTGASMQTYTGGPGGASIGLTVDPSQPTLNGIAQIIVSTTGSLFQGTGTQTEYDFEGPGAQNAFYPGNHNATVGAVPSLGLPTFPWASTVTKLLNIPETAAPALSAAGFGRIYADSTAHTFQVSNNGGAYTTLGNVTGTFTTGAVPVASGAHSLVNNPASAILDVSGGTSTVGSHSLVFAVGTGGSITNSDAGAFIVSGHDVFVEMQDDIAGSGGSTYFFNADTTHAAFAELQLVGATATNSQARFDAQQGTATALVLSDVTNGIATVTINADSTATSGSPTSLVVSPTDVIINGTNFVFGPSPASISGQNAYFQVGGLAIAPGGFTNAFLVIGTKNVAFPIGADIMIGALSNQLTQLQTVNKAYTAQGTISTVLVNVGGAATANGDHSISSLDAGDAVGNVFLHVESPGINSGTHGSVVIDNDQAAGSKPYFIQQVDGSHSIAFLPPSTTSPAFEVFTWPAAYPAANGQPLVSTTAGVMSFAAGKTQAYVVCTGAACATSCTLTFTGGILTANSGTCP